MLGKKLRIEPAYMIHLISLLKEGILPNMY